jgi:hypothetical protein
MCFDTLQVIISFALQPRSLARLLCTFKHLFLTGDAVGPTSIPMFLYAILVGSRQSGVQIAVFSNVLADLGDSQSLEQSLSTFSGHMARVKVILETAGPESLVLLDELGSGTDPVEGSALAISLLRTFCKQVLPLPLAPSWSVTSRRLALRGKSLWITCSGIVCAACCTLQCVLLGRVALADVAGPSDSCPMTLPTHHRALPLTHP